MNEFEYCVFIGKFSPFDGCQKVLLDKALSIADKVIVVIGSANTARSIKNPWSTQERKDMITLSMSSPEELKRIIFVEMEDYLYNDNLWISTLQSKINEATDYSDKVAIIENDNSLYYAKLFPQFSLIKNYATSNIDSSIQIRDLYFSHDAAYKTMVPDPIVSYLENFKHTTRFNYVKEEKDYIDNYKSQWHGAPFPPTFMTVDSVVIKSGHVLVVNRKHNPGKGLLALPGGFLNPKETLEEGALRELKEETKIKINIPDLKKCIVESKVFDYPLRSARGRTITNAYLINLGMGPLPQVKGSDDAESAQWLQLGEFYDMSRDFFEDHWHIIRYFVSKF